jgi:hypothetical protein
MKRISVSVMMIICMILVSAFAFAQEFPPTYKQGPFPTGKEPVRADAPADVNIPDQAGTIHEYTAYKGTPVVDGNVDTDAVWNQIPWTAMDSYDGNTPYYLFDGGWEGIDGIPQGWDDICAWFKVMWDNDNIYVALKKRDDSYTFVEDHMTNTGNIWQDDAYQIVFRTNDPVSNSGSGLAAEVGVSLLAIDNPTFNNWGTTPMELADGNSSSNSPSGDKKAFMGSQTDHGSYYTEVQEIAFKRWPEMTADTPQMFSIMCNDPDADNTVQALCWTQGIFSSKTETKQASIVYSTAAIPSTGSDTFPPVLKTGPFPTGKEAARNDAPCDENVPNSSGILHEYTAYRGTPVIDGNVDADDVWNTVPWTVMDTYDASSTYANVFDGGWEGVAGYPQGWDDITAWFKILWDDDNVYFALKKRDNENVYVEEHMTDTGNIWQDDAYQIVLNTNDPAVGSDGSGISTNEVGVALLAIDNPTFNNWGSTPLVLADGNSSSNSPSGDQKAFMGSQVYSDTYYTEVIELAFIKWPEIVANEPQLFSIMANDPDTDNSVQALCFGPGIFSTKTWTKYASILYSPNGAPTAVEEKNPSALPTESALCQNYPNPFNPSTTISYRLTQPARVRLEIFDTMGRLVTTVVDENQGAGYHSARFDAGNMNTGAYLYKLTAGSLVDIKKMLYVK